MLFNGLNTTQMFPIPWEFWIPNIRGSLGPLESTPETGSGLVHWFSLFRVAHSRDQTKQTDRQTHRATCNICSKVPAMRANRNPKVIWEEPRRQLPPLTTENNYATKFLSVTMGRQDAPYLPQNCPFPFNDLHPDRIHSSLD